MHCEHSQKIRLVDFRAEKVHRIEGSVDVRSKQMELVTRQSLWSGFDSFGTSKEPLAAIVRSLMAMFSSDCVFVTGSALESLLVMHELPMALCLWHRQRGLYLEQLVITTMY